MQRRTLFLTLFAAAVPLAASAQPWWDAEKRHAEWQAFREEERRRRVAEFEGRREAWREEHWREERERAEWERRQREEARIEWEREQRRLGRPY